MLRIAAGTILRRSRRNNNLIGRGAGDGVDYDHNQGWSVVVRGVLHHLDHNEIELLAKRFDPRPWLEQDRTSWLAIKPQVITGRRLLATQPDWAFSPEAYL